MAKIIDLDAIVLDDIEVILGGKTWLIPGDIDVLMIFKMMKYSQSEDEKDQVKAIGLIEGLFRHRHSEEELENLSLGMHQAQQLMQGIMKTVTPKKNAKRQMKK